MSKHTDSNGNIMPTFVFVAFGEFKGPQCLVRYPQDVKGLTWRKLSQALRRYLRTHLGLKANGYWDIMGIMVAKPEHCHDVWAKSMKTKKMQCLDFNMETGEFFHANP